MSKIIAHVDMDCFFCACEQKRNPSIKGKPVIVGGNSRRGVVSAANYEVRKFGVHSAMPISKALRFCPNVINLPVDYAYYKSESNQIMNILRQVSDDFLQASIDEAYIDLTSFARQFKSLKLLGEWLKSVVYDKTSLTCSIGISHCSTTSKIASDFNKPFGVTVVENQAEFLKSLAIGKMPGIGKVSRIKYMELGLKTLGDLANADRFFILDHFGMCGIKFQQIVQGIHRSAIAREIKQQSISKEHTFSEDTDDESALLIAIDSMCQAIYRRLNNRYFKTISLKIRYHDFRTITRDLSLQTMRATLTSLRKIVKDFFLKAYDGDIPLRLIGVKLTNIVTGSHKQTTLAAFI